MTAYARYIGIDYSGARTADTPLPGLRAYVCEAGGEAQEARPDSDARRHWSRRGLTHWLAERLRENVATAVGIDHSFSFPQPYFEACGLAPEWQVFLEDFERHWPTHAHDVSVDAIRDGQHGNGAARAGNSRWRRFTDRRSPGAKSPFHFDVPGSVAKSTHAGLPWLLFLRRQLGPRIHCWPFDGWQPRCGVSLVAEVYPSMWNRIHPRGSRSADQHDAFSVACWLRDADGDGRLAQYFHPALSPSEHQWAPAEGWILGVV